MEKEVNRLFSTHGRPKQIQTDKEWLEHVREEGHTIKAYQVVQAHQNSDSKAKYFTNKGENRRGPVVMVGLTYAGWPIKVPIEPTGQNGVWRAITSYPANNGDIQRYERSQQ
jgi:hypothetical protein